MKLFNWFQRTPPRGVHSSEAAARWASTRFASPLQPIAAYVAHTLHEQLGIELSDIEPSSTFTGDLRIDWGESMEVILAIQEDLSIALPDEAPGTLNTVTDLVSYLQHRLSPMTATPPQELEYGSPHEEGFRSAAKSEGTGQKRRQFLLPLLRAQRVGGANPAPHRLRRRFL